MWILNSTSFSPQSSLSLTMPGYRCGGSCTTSVRNSVNFTLRCSPKIPQLPPPKKKKEMLAPDSVIWRLKSHSSPGPAASVLCLLDETPGRHLWVVGWRLITSNGQRPVQTTDTAQSVRRSGRLNRSQFKEMTWTTTKQQIRSGKCRANFSMKIVNNRSQNKL